MRNKSLVCLDIKALSTNIPLCKSIKRFKNHLKKSKTTLLLLVNKIIINCTVGVKNMCVCVCVSRATRRLPFQYLLHQVCYILPLIHTLYCWVLSKKVSSTIFNVFGMTRPGIEPNNSFVMEGWLVGCLGFMAYQPL